jgi:chaperone BCS1
MFDQIWTFIQDQLATNNFLSGGAVLMVLGGAAAYFRDLPGRLYRRCVRFFFLEFEIVNNDAAFDWFSEWLAAQSYSQNRARWLSVKSINRDCGPGEPPKILLTPAPGVHWLWWSGHFLIVNRTRKETTSGENGTGFKVEREVFTVSMVTRSRANVMRLLEEVRETVCPQNDRRVPVYIQQYSDWNQAYKKRPRPLESIILPPEVLDSLVADLTRFRESEEWYCTQGIPYRRGYMLCGPPGSGKSSCVYGVCSQLRMGIAVMNLSDPSLSDSYLRELLCNIPSNTVVLIEDIDCIFTNRTEKKGNTDNRVTFSGLLNALDGISAGDGTIVFMTTNYPEKLDEALIRPGRCDRKVFIGLPDEDQINRLFLRFYPECPAIAKEFTEQVVKRGVVSMATLQGHFLQRRDDAGKALLEIEQMYTQPFRSADESEEQSKQVA